MPILNQAHAVWHSARCYTYLNVSSMFPNSARVEAVSPGRWTGPDNVGREAKSSSPHLPPTIQSGSSTVSLASPSIAG